MDLWSEPGGTDMAIEYDIICLSESDIGVFSGETLEGRFTTTVEMRLNDGWQLAGGIAVTENRSGKQFHQAVYREAESP
jgi:hypothetical protein